MTIITTKLLKNCNTCKEGIKFFRNNFSKELFPDGLNLNNIKVTGDYKCYFYYVNNLPEIQYDNNGNIVRKTYPDGDVYRNEYDNNRNIIKTIYPTGSVYRYEYDTNGNCIKELYPNGEEICHYEYDTNGNRIKETYPNGDVYRHEYDSNNNLIKKILPNGDVRQYEYDSKGNMIKEVYPSGTIYETIFKYDSIGRLNQVNDCYIEYL
jgi:YD repeat-containing protein